MGDSHPQPLKIPKQSETRDRSESVTIRADKHYPIAEHGSNAHPEAASENGPSVG